MRFIAAAVQMLATSEKDENLAEAERWIRLARDRGASLVALPEVFNWRGRPDSERSHAEAIPGPTSHRMKELARELGIYLLAGSIAERVEGELKVYNTSLLFGPGGEMLARYRKLHLFDVELGEGVKMSESNQRQPGDQVVVSDTPLGPMGLSICYDLRFPELYRRLVANGAKLVFVPSVFTVPTGQAHWEILLRARAIENQLYLIAPDQTGPHPASMEAYGHSMIVDPWGRILARRAAGPGVICAEIDLDYLDRLRMELPALRHRREFL